MKAEGDAAQVQASKTIKTNRNTKTDKKPTEITKLLKKPTEKLKLIKKWNFKTNKNQQKY